MELPLDYKFDFPGYNVLPVGFQTCETLDTSSVDIIGRIVKITNIECFIQPKTDKVSCKRHMFLVDKTEKVLPIAIFGQRCFKIGKNHIDKVVLIKGVSIKRHESGFQYINVNEKSLFLTQPQSLINDMLKGTEGIDKNNLVTFVFCFARVLKWGTFGKGKYEFAGTPTKTPNRKNQDVLYTRVTLHDATGVQSQVSLFSNRLASFINKSEIGIRKMIEEKNGVHFYGLLDQHKEQLLLFKIKMSEGFAKGRFFNLTIDKIITPTSE